MPGNPFTDPNWAPDLADTVERVVGTVRDKTTTHVVTAVRALVFGIVISVAALAALVLLVIVGTKLLQRVLDIFVDYDSSVSFSYLLLGALLLAAGFLLMRKRRTKAVA
jgi:LPXTG-motif cell wall-anchored protein